MADLDAEILPPTSIPLLRSDAPVLLPFHEANPKVVIITASSPHYGIVHKEYNTWNQTVPLAKLFPASIAQLVASISFCTSQTPPIPITVRGGGHDAYGRNALSGAVQLDLRLMKWTKLLPSGSSGEKSPIAAVGPGVTGIEMQRELAAAGLAAATGWTGSVGVTGWACGGGYGFETGAWGLGVDNILGARLVTAAGDVVDTDQDPELLWAIRGAGLGNFGVICELRLRTRPDPKYLAGFLAFPMAEARQVLSGFQALVDEGLPAAFSGELLLHGTPAGQVISVLFAWTCAECDAVEAGWSYLEKLKLLGTVAFDTVKETSVLAYHEYLHSEPEFNSRGYTTMHSLSLARITPSLIDVLIAHPIPAGTGGGIMFHHAHGKALQPQQQRQQPPMDPGTVWSHRDQHYIFTPFGFAGLDAAVETRTASKRWADDVFGAVQAAGLGLPKAYWSLTRPEHCDATRYFGANAVGKLRRLKAKMNPDDAFPAALPVLT